MRGLSPRVEGAGQRYQAAIQFALKLVDGQQSELITDVAFHLSKGHPTPLKLVGRQRHMGGKAAQAVVIFLNIAVGNHRAQLPRLALSLLAGARVRRR